ncbi:MAG: hypothetical protein M1829_004894 [Trizodia sp. TS-e1964]|nr:MAG: hypothetical protein M1829_004894 [Trizodia sp. TS-e1964]
MSRNSIDGSRSSGSLSNSSKRSSTTPLDQLRELQPTHAELPALPTAPSVQRYAYGVNVPLIAPRNTNEGTSPPRSPSKPEYAPRRDSSSASGITDWRSETPIKESRSTKRQASLNVDGPAAARRATRRASRAPNGVEAMTPVVRTSSRSPARNANIEKSFRKERKSYADSFPEYSSNSDPMAIPELVRPSLQDIAHPEPSFLHYITSPFKFHSIKNTLSLMGTMFGLLLFFRFLLATNVLDTQLDPTLPPLDLTNSSGISNHITALWSRLSKVEKRLTVVEKDVASLLNSRHLEKETINKLDQLLPNEITFKRNADGSIYLPDDIWQSFKKKMMEDAGIKDGAGTSLWDSFVKKGKDKLNNASDYLTKAQVIEMLDDKWGAADASVRRQAAEFAAKLEKLAKKSNKLEENVLTNALSVTNTEVHRLFKAGAWRKYLPIAQMDAIINSQGTSNAASALRLVNFFSERQGARINPFHTSPTMKFPWFLTPNPPRAALSDWKEVGDSWCAASGPSQPVHLGILLNQKIYIDQLTLEHIPRSATLDAASTPKDFELWVHMPNRSEFNELERQVSESNILAHAPLTGGLVGLKQNGYVYVGSWRYNINAMNHIQSFKLNVDMVGKFSSRRVVVRVIGSWDSSSDHICIYRIRGHGVVADDELREKYEKIYPDTEII